MPTISMFYGIIISMFFEIKEKHYSPHILVRYQGYRASIAIDAGGLRRVSCLRSSYAWFRFG